MLCRPVRVPAALPVRVLPKKGRPRRSRPGRVVPFDIVNWEGNYILDTNTFLIVIPHP